VRRECRKELESQRSAIAGDAPQLNSDPISEPAAFAMQPDELPTPPPIQLPVDVQRECRKEMQSQRSAGERTIVPAIANGTPHTETSEQREIAAGDDLRLAVTSKPKTEEELLTRSVAAKYLTKGGYSVKPKTLANWASLKKGPPFTKLGGKSLRYARSGLDDWIRAKRASADIDSEKK